jgi:hypothetical protein
MLTVLRYKAAARDELINGFATALSAWLLLAGPDKKHIGGTRGGGRGNNPKGSGKLPGDSDCPNANIEVEMILCDSPKFEDRKESDVQEVWQSYHADQKWCQVMSMLRTIQRDNNTFAKNSSPSEKVAKYLGFKSQTFVCGNAAQADCKDTEVKCTKPLIDAAAVLILQSFINLSDVSRNCNHFVVQMLMLLTVGPKDVGWLGISFSPRDSLFWEDPRVLCPRTT